MKRYNFGHLMNSKKILQGSAHMRTIALTFDDGPVEPFTSQVLGILKKYKVKATFFLLAKNIERFPTTVQNIVKEGHEIGNHTYSHPDLGQINPFQLMKEIKKAEQIIFSFTGKKTTLFRPPYGSDNFFLSLILSLFNYRSVLWTVDPVDWENPFSRINVELIMKKMRPGSILLLHDGVEDNPRKQFDRQHTIDQLPYIIERLKKKNFQFKTISELLHIT
jgi:peptidoglycan/xylan/chitin deacetylase (PgdA/CDA1 family)